MEKRLRLENAFPTIVSAGNNSLENPILLFCPIAYSLMDVTGPRRVATITPNSVYPCTMRSLLQRPVCSLCLQVPERVRGSCYARLM
jgi:hypothetical protein